MNALIFLSIVPPSASCCGFNSKVSHGYCVTHRDFTFSHITFGFFPFVNALLLLSIVPPSASCQLRIQFKRGSMGIVLPIVTLHSFAYHIWSLSFCECSFYYRLFHLRHLVFVDSIHGCPVGNVTLRDSTCWRITFGSLLFVNALISLSIVPPSASLLWIRFKCRRGYCYPT